jgi:acyl-CoA thioester hydrolase
LQPAFAGERVVVHTWVSSFRKIQSLRKYKIMRVDDGAILAVAATNWAFVGLKHRVPRRVPEALSRAFIVVDQHDEP